MTKYWVSTDSKNPGWWPHAEYPRYKMNARRPATEEEEILMNKAEREDISVEEIANLKKMIRRVQISNSETYD